MSLIEMNAITKVYRMGKVEVQALAGVDLSVEAGEFMSIMGPSGSGKTTLMNIIGLLDRPSSGIYNLEGREASRLGERDLAALRGRKIGFVFQNFNLLPRASAQENVELSLVYAGVGQRKRRAMEALGMVGLGDRARHRPNELSGGEQQRVAIARALAKGPSLILADEPTGNLDSRIAGEVMSILEMLHREQGITVIVITHDPEVADRTHRIVTLRDGAIIHDVHNPTRSRPKPWRCRNALSIQEPKLITQMIHRRVDA